jgi:thiamine-phosphate pyrophosphorylase
MIAAAANNRDQRRDMPKDTRARLFGLYAVTPDDDDTVRLLTRIKAALAGGAAAVQYRNKRASRALRREQAGALLALCRQHRAPLIINDHLDLALELGADGVHLGGDDGSVAQARAMLGPNKLIGASCYNLMHKAIAAEREGADYVAFGSFFASGVKPDAVHAPLDLLAQAKRSVSLPVAAIGGITLANASQLIAAGADMVAVISALFGAADINIAAKQFTVLFNKP